MKILLIEDDKVQAETLAKLLDKASAQKVEIFIAHALREGIDKSWEVLADVTYLDLCLPDAVDWKVVAHSIPKMYPPVIIVTGMDDPDQEIKLECFTYGAQNFFQKQRDMKLLVPHLLSTGAAAHLRRDAPKRLAHAAST